MPPRKKKTDTATKTAAAPAKAAAKARVRTTKKGKMVAETAVNERAVTPPERLEGDPSADVKGELQHLLDEACNNKTAKDPDADEGIAQELRKILLSWRDVQPQAKPQKLVYLLETAQGRKKLRLSALDEDDAKKVTLLDVHARKYGFHVGLSEAVFYEQGYGLSMGGGYGHNRYLHASGKNVQMEEVHETKLTLENLVGLDGTKLADAVGLTAETEVMPEDLQKKLKRRGHTTQIYSASECSRLERWYRGKVLLIWPKRHHFDILHGPDALKHACAALVASVSAQPTSEARDLVETILSRTDLSQSGDVVNSVCHAAVLWGDADLWMRAVRTCEADHAISALGCENVVAAIGAFGFDVIKECVERALGQDLQYSSALLLLRMLEDKAAGEDGGSAAFAFAGEWTPEWRLKVVGALKNPGVDEAEAIVSAGVNAGGAKILEKTITPALKKTAEPAFMFVLSEKVHAAEGITPGVKKRIVKDILVFALSQAKPYDTMNDAETFKFAEAAIKACLLTENEPSAAELVQRLVDFSGLDETAARQRSRDVLLPLAGAISKFAGDSPSVKVVKAVKPIYDTAIAQFLQGLSAVAKVDTEDVQALLDVAGMGMSVSDIIEKMLPLKLDCSVLDDFIKALNKRRSAGTVHGIDAALAALAQKFAQVAGIKGGTTYWYFNIPPTVVHSIACCVRADVPAAALTIIERVLVQHPAEEGYVAEAVFMICVCLPKMLAQLQRAPTDPAYAALYARLYTFWVDVKMGPLRATPRLDASVAALVGRISTWKEECDCYDCGSLRSFVRGWKGEHTFSDVGDDACKHMEEKLAKRFDGQVYCERTSGSEPGLKVTKHASFLVVSQWRTWKEEANSILNSLTENTSEEDIKVIFGDDYARIMQTIRGTTAAAVNSLGKRPAECVPEASGSGSAGPPAAKRRKV